jgi:hypothetical protein
MSNDDLPPYSSARQFGEIMMTSHAKALKTTRADREMHQAPLMNLICSFHLPCAEAFACCWKPVVVISSFYVGLHFVV